MKELAPIIQSVSDTRKYKIIQLENGLECIIISDPDTKKASASLSVGVGSLQDPVEVQGIAHYLEHMLFMGTKKYPDENIYRLIRDYLVRRSVRTQVLAMLTRVRMRPITILKWHACRSGRF